MGVKAKSRGKVASMTAGPSFPPELPGAWKGTRVAAHADVVGVNAIPRANTDAHPNWWRVTLTADPDGVGSDTPPLPEGELLTFTAT